MEREKTKTEQLLVSRAPQLKLFTTFMSVFQLFSV